MFTVSIPDIFFYNPMLDTLELALVFTALVMINVLYSPSVNVEGSFYHKEHVYEYLQSAWLGNEALWRVFWPFPILVILVYMYIDYRVENISFTIASWRTVHGMLALPLVWYLTSVWKCSANTQYKYAAILARSIALFFVLISLLRILTSYEYPEQLYDCKLLVLEYGDC